MNSGLTLATIMASLFVANYSYAREVVPLWPETKAGVEDSSKEKMDAAGHVRNVRFPTLTVFKPADEASRKGIAVIVCPGGGYTVVSYRKEGERIAEWFNSFGVTAFVLKYRLPATEGVDYKHPVPLDDVQQAIRIVRKNANEYEIDPEKIGVCGFSAGGHLAATAATLYDNPVNEAAVSCRPDFMILIYPVVSFIDENIVHKGSRSNLIGSDADQELKTLLSPEQNVDKDTPPAFIVHATSDNAVDHRNSVGLYKALRNSGVSAEMHIYKDGGHGFGLGRKGDDSANWPKACRKWLESLFSKE